MAEAYQLPGEFRPSTSMEKTAFISGDTRSLDQENMNNFLRQLETGTNINLANQQQSMREKQYQQLASQFDREFSLRQEKQDQDIRVGDLNFEVKKFAYDSERKNYERLQEAWSQKDTWMDAADTLMPNGGNSPTYLADKAKLFRSFAKDPASFGVLQELLKPYDDQYNVYKATKTIEDEATIQAGFESGLFDGEMIGDTEASAYWRETQFNRQADPIGYGAGVRNLQKIIGRKTEEEKRQLARLQQGADLGTFEAMRMGAGLPVSKMTMKDGKVEYEAATPRVFGTGSRATSETGLTPSGISALSTAAKNFSDRAEELTETIQLAKEKVDASSDPIDKAAAQEELNTLTSQQSLLRSAATRSTEQAMKLEQPSTSQSSGASKTLGKLPKEIKDVKTPAPKSSPTPTPVPETPQKNKDISAESLLSPEAQALLGAGRTAGKVGGAIVRGAGEAILKTSPVLSGAAKGIESAKSIFEGVGAATKVVSEVSSYLKKTEEAAKRAEARAAAGEDIQEALLDEQSKLIEELAPKRKTTSAL